MLKITHDGTFPKFGEMHLVGYVAEFEDKHNVRKHDTLSQMSLLARGMVDQKLEYRDSIAKDRRVG